MTSKIIGTGAFLPENITTNDYLAGIVETSDEWISDRTGIKERRITTGLTTSELAAKAASIALLDSKTNPLEIDLIITATITPDKSMPSTSCEVQALIGASNAFCFDINAACSGFIYAMNTAHAYILSGIVKKALIIGAETLSRIIDWSDRTTCVLFGDGAGAAVLCASDDGIINITAGSDGTKSNFLSCRSTPLNNPYTREDEYNPYIKMDGQEVFKFAIRKIPEIINSLLNETNIKAEDLQCILLHQANRRIIQAATKRLLLDENVFPINLDKYGNTSAASLPILLDELNKGNKLLIGKPLIMCGFGGGFTWGGVLMNW